MNKRVLKAGTGALLGAALFVSPLGGASAIAQSADAHGTHRAHVTNRSVTVQRHFTDTDVFRYMMFASGPIAKKHPNYAATLRHGRTIHEPSVAQTRKVVGLLKRIDPQYHRRVTLAVQQNDPYAAQAGMKRLSQDLNELFAPKKAVSHRQGAAQHEARRMRANGWVWHDTFVATEAWIGAVMAALAYEAVGAAHVAVIVLAIVPAAASYQFEMNKASSIDRQNFVVAVTKGCSA